MERQTKTSDNQQKKNKLVKIIIAILVIIIILLLLRSCTKRAPLKVDLSEDWFYSSDVTTDVIENIVSVNDYTLSHDGEVYISESNSVVYREGDYEFEFVAEYGDVIVTVTDGNNVGQADCLVMKGVDWYLTNDEGEDTVKVKELYYSSTPTLTNDDDNTSSAPVAPSTPSTPSNPTDGGNGGESGSGDSDQPTPKPGQVELGGSLGGDHQVAIGNQPSDGSGDGAGNGGSDNGSTGSGNADNTGNNGTVVVIPNKDVTGTITGENNIANNPGLSHDSTSIGDRVVSKPAPSTPAPADTPAASADNGGNNNTSTDAGKPADGGASKPAPAPTPQPQPENPPVVVETPAPAPADNTPAPADDTPVTSDNGSTNKPTIICDENGGDCKIVW